MKAAVLESYGDAGNFVIKELETPQLEQGQILISNRASSVNPIDVAVRKGNLRLQSGLFGLHVIGSDYSGVVIESKSNLFKVGDEVFGFKNPLKGHTYAGQVVVDEDNAALKPANLSFTEAAALPLAAVTAWQAMVTIGKLQQNARVIINGCTGGVGTAAVQIAKSFNAHVTGVCSGKHAGFARMIGCDEVIDYDTQEIAGDMEYDLFFDAAGNLTISDVKPNVADEGMFVSTKGGMKDLKSTLVGVRDLLFDRHMKILFAKPKAIDLHELAQLAEAGKLKPYIAENFKLTELSQAHLLQEKGGFSGKISIEI